MLRGTPVFESQAKVVGPRVPRVLVAFDASPGAWAALEYGIAAAQARDAMLTIAAVVYEPPLSVGFSLCAVPCTRESLRRDRERDLARALAAARDEVPAALSMSTKLLHGRPDRVLAHLAECGRYDLVVAGRGRTGRLRQRWRRSVAVALVSRCRTAVLTVEPPARA